MAKLGRMARDQRNGTSHTRKGKKAKPLPQRTATEQSEAAVFQGNESGQDGPEQADGGQGWAGCLTNANTPKPAFAQEAASRGRAVVQPVAHRPEPEHHTDHGRKSEPQGCKASGGRLNTLSEHDGRASCTGRERLNHQAAQHPHAASRVLLARPRAGKPPFARRTETLPLQQRLEEELARRLAKKRRRRWP